MPDIKLSLFGKFQLQVKDSPVTLKRKKSEVLVSYLALHPGLHTREKIASILWADALSGEARASLRVVLNDIRKTLGEDILSNERDLLQLNSQSVYVDVWEFERLLKRVEEKADADLLAALDFYQAELLEDSYEEWLPLLRVNFHEMALKARELLLERARTDGDYPRSVQYARSALLKEPAHEKFIQHLIFSLAASGEKEQALRQFEDFQERNGIELSKETIALVEEIKKRPVENAVHLTNLPRQLTSFIGREDELNQIQTLLGENRLLTLLGPGGSGKTRLAIQTADEVLHDFQQGVWWVDLSPLAEPDLVVQSIARVLGVKDQLGYSLYELLGQFIAEKRLMLVLDNCEHLLAASARCVEYLLSCCPSLVVLTTSREPLGVLGEVQWSVPAFPLPEADLHLKFLRKNESIRLFIERGRAANGSFQLDETNASFAADICRRLDGIPLAIELAASLLKDVSIRQLSEQLDEKFKVLAMADALRLPRQKTLRALMDWSYDLLTPAEQTLFRRLGVFAGGWTLSSATIVAGGYEWDSLNSVYESFSSHNQVLPLPVTPLIVVSGLLDSLTRRSLIRTSRLGTDVRYDMLETLREYAIERLKEANELDTLHSRHLAEITRFAREATLHLLGMPDQLQWTELVAHEVDNVRAALRWALSTGEIKTGLELGAGMSRFWTLRYFWKEMQDWLESLCAEISSRQFPAERAYVLVWRGLSFRNGDIPNTAFSCIKEALQIFQEINDNSGTAFAFYGLGEMHYHAGLLDDATMYLVDGLVCYRLRHENTFDRYHYTSVLSALSRTETSRRNYAVARQYAEEALQMAVNMGDVNGVGWAKLLMGDLSYHLDDIDLAEKYFQESLVIYRMLNRVGNLAYLLEALASISFSRSEYANAISYVEESLKLYDSINAWSTFSRAYRAAIALRQRDTRTARQWLLRCVTPLSDIELEYRATYLVRLGDFAFAQADFPSAALIYSAALRFHTDPISGLFPSELRDAQAGLNTLQSTMDEADFDLAVRRGAKLSFEEAVRIIFPEVV